jgi:AhpD family alkylhydroperoxidase
MSTAQTTHFMPLTISTAPDSSKPILCRDQEIQWLNPKPDGYLANNRVGVEGYRTLEAVWENGSFVPRERQLILLAASADNRCSYCTAAHSTVLKTALLTPAELVFAIQHNIPVPDAKFNAVVKLVKELAHGRGYARQESIQNFIDAGYRKQQVMEMLVGIVLKTISNYLDHLSPVPVDQAFATESK